MYLWRINLSLYVRYILANSVVLGSNHHIHIRDSATTTFPDPYNDPFYKAPPNLNNFRPGEIIRSRKVETRISSKKVLSSHQVLYRTMDTQHQAEATVATLWKPINPRSPPQIFSYHVWMDSDAFDCSPSWAWIKHSKSNNLLPVTLDAPIYVEWALDHGIYVVSPDDEGPKSAFMSGFQQGQVCL